MGKGLIDHCFSGKLWYLQHNCVGDNIVYYLDSEMKPIWWTTLQSRFQFVCHGQKFNSLVFRLQPILHIPSTRPTNDIWIEFVIRPKFEVLWFQMCSTESNEILHTLQNFIVIGWAFFKLEHSKFWSNSIKIPSVGQGPWQQCIAVLCCFPLCPIL